MKIAVHHRVGSFSERWIEYFKKNKVPFKIVNCYDNDIVNQLDDCDGLMWHHRHGVYKDVLSAKPILYSLEQAGIKVFPNFNTAWHFDDKLGQKYLLEAIKAPIIPTYVFYNKEEALAMIEKLCFPMVFKLRYGAGSSNVSLINNQQEARRIVKKAFGKGFPRFNRIGLFRERIRKVREGKESYRGIVKGFGRLFIPYDDVAKHANEREYVYMQEFIKNDGYDVRVVVIDKKAAALKRLVRKNDFRASGGGNLVFENENIDKRFIELAFNLSKKLKAQCIAFDFIKDVDSNIYVVELSYGFPMLNFLELASGYWTDDLKWHEEKFNMQWWIAESFLEEIESESGLFKSYTHRSTM